MSDISADATVSPKKNSAAPGLRLTPADRARAIAILHHTVSDLSGLISCAASVTFDNAPELEPDMAHVLSDAISVAPIFSAADLTAAEAVMTPADFEAVLRSRGAAKLPAAKVRRSVTVCVSGSAIRFSDGQGVANPAANDHAPRALRDLQQYSAEPVQDGLIRLHDIPGRASEGLLSALCDITFDRLHARFEFEDDAAQILLRRLKERAVLQLCEVLQNPRDIGALTGAMHGAGRLTSSVIARAAGAGHLRFAEYALARRAGVTHAKASLMLYAPGDIGIKALSGAADISVPDLHILRAAIAIYRELETNGREYDRAYFRRLMIERVLALEVDFSDCDSDYILETLDGHGALEFA